MASPLSTTPAPWTYTTANLSEAYLSDPIRKHTGMDDLAYWATDLILDSVFKHQV